MYENSKLTERILDRPFTVKSFTYQDNMAIISVEGLKDMFIDVDEDFRIDAAGTSLGQRQKDYLGRYYYDISKKLMELSGMSSDEIEVYLEKLKTERTMNTEDFLRKFKPNYKGLIYDFSKYVEIYHISARWSDYAVYTEKVLKESWEEFYRGSNWDGQRFCHFRPEKYLGIIGKRDVVDLNEWTKFADSNIGYGLGIGSGPTYYSLKSLDEAFEEFESSLGKVEESIESKLAENFANELKNLQKEGLFENVKSFDLDFNEKGINIKLNESINQHDTPFLFFLKTKQYLCEEFFKQLYGVDNNSIVTNFQKEVIKKCNISVNEFKSNTLWGIYFSHLTPFIKEEDIFRIIEDHNGESLLQKEFGSVEALKECMNRIDLLRPDNQAFERMKKFFSLFISDVEDWKNKTWNKTWSENLNLLSGYILGNISWEVLDDKIRSSKSSKTSSKTSTTPFMDEIFSLAQKIYIFDEIIDKWPDSYDYYSEVAESVGDDYDDIKDRFDFDQLGLSDCIEFITEHDGENIAKKMFGTIENIQKSFEEYDSNEDVKNVLTQFVDYFRDDLNEYEEQYWRECIDSAISDWNAYYSDDDN